MAINYDNTVDLEFMIARKILSSLGHVFEELEVRRHGKEFVTAIECTRCGGSFTYDTETRKVIGGEPFGLNEECAGCGNKA